MSVDLHFSNRKRWVSTLIGLYISLLFVWFSKDLSDLYSLCRVNLEKRGFCLLFSILGIIFILIFWSFSLLTWKGTFISLNFVNYELKVWKSVHSARWRLNGFFACSNYYHQETLRLRNVIFYLLCVSNTVLSWELCKDLGMVVKMLASYALIYFLRIIFERRCCLRIKSFFFVALELLISSFTKIIIL